MQVQPHQTYSYEMPVYNTYPGYGNPNAFSAYGAGMPNQSIFPSANMGVFGGAELSNIPPNPQYPGLGDYSNHHNRVPEIQEPELIIQETPTVSKTESNDSAPGGARKSKENSSKGSTAKVKTSSHNSKSTKSVARTERTSQGRRTESAKKRRNPWISN